VVEDLNDQDRVCTGDGDDVVAQVRGWGVFVDLGSGNDRVDARRVAIVNGGEGDDGIVVAGGPSDVRGGRGDDVIRAVARTAPHVRAANTPCATYSLATRGVRVDLDRGRARGEGKDRLVNLRCVTGSRYDDVVIGTRLSDEISTLAGFDLVRSADGNDRVNSGANADRVYLGDGNDYGLGGAGWDRLYGQDGNDTLEGWTDGDYLDGGTGDDQVFGGFFCELSGNSYGNGGVLDTHGNEVFGGPGNDYLTGDLGNDRLDGGPGFDRGQGGYRDARADSITSLEVIDDDCMPYGWRAGPG